MPPKDYINLLKEHHVLISVPTQGNLEENGYAEQLIHTIKEEEVDLSECYYFPDAVVKIKYFIDEAY